MNSRHCPVKHLSLFFSLILFAAGCSSLQRTDRYLVDGKTAKNAAESSQCVQLTADGGSFEVAPFRTSHMVAVGIPFVPLIPSSISHKNFRVNVSALDSTASSKIHPKDWRLKIGSALVAPSEVRERKAKDVELVFPEQLAHFDKFTLITAWTDKSGRKIEINFLQKFGSMEYHPFSVMSYKAPCSVVQL